MKDQEIEIKVQIKNIKPLLKFLAKNAQFKYETHQVDDYFTPAHRDFIAPRPINEWLRLRISEKNCSINYKNWHREKDGSTYFCDEYETGVENIEQLRKILDVLNFKLVVQVDKTRKVWTFKDFEIALDSAQNLGEFVEVEYIGKKKILNHKKMVQKMLAFLKEVGCKNIKENPRGYPYLLLFPNEE